MNRVVIVGCGGSGKSTLAQQLGKSLDIDVFHMDMLFWKPGWVRVSEPEQNRILAEIVKQEKWIIDGDHPPTQHLRFSMADTIVFLDMPQAVCLWRTFKRVLQNRGQPGLGVAEGCPERINWVLLKWILLYRRVNRPKLMQNIRQYSAGRQVIVLHQSKEVDKFINSVGVKVRP